MMMQSVEYGPFKVDLRDRGGNSKHDPDIACSKNTTYWRIHFNHWNCRLNGNAMKISQKLENLDT